MRFKCFVSYDGSNFSGWQIQKNARTIQEEIQKVLSIICKEEIIITASGRTDAGVHAVNQVFHFDCDLDIPWEKAMNALLPSDIHINHVAKVSQNFHARFDASSKRYVYKINVGDYNVFGRDYILQYNRYIDVNKLKEALNLFIGTHDFTSYNKTPIHIIPNQVRTISNIMVDESEEIVTIEIVGDGFLRHMIRMLIATALAYAEGKISLNKIKYALETPDKNLIQFNVEGCGLYLKGVDYTSY